MRTTLVLSVTAFALSLSCESTPPSPRAASPSPLPLPSPAPTPDASVDDAAATKAAATKAAGAFIRQRPQSHELRSVDACAYVGGFGFACIDALVQEPDPVRARYMRRLSDAYARLNRDQDLGAPAHAELSECCNAAGPCGAVAKKTGHTDCPKMDDGYACLTAAELRASGKQSPKSLHERACHCDWKRAQIPVMGGLLACDGPDKPVKRGVAGGMDEREAREVTTCGVCDPAEGPASCAAEIARLRARDGELARYIETIHLTRCQVP